MYRIIFILFLFISFHSIAQDTIVKITGRIKTGVEVMKVDSDYVYYLKEGKKTVDNQGRMKPNTMERPNVFEVYYSNGKKELAYIQDTIGFILAPELMRSYVHGCTDAFDLAHNRVVGSASFLLTVGSSFILKPFYVVAVPMLLSGAVAMFTPEFPDGEIVGEKVNEYYIMGYQDTKKIKKVKSTVFFGIVGIAASFVIVFAK